MSHPLRQYQTDAIQALRQSLAQGRRRPVLMAPTGAGKTVIAGEIFKLARARGTRVLFAVPAISLIDQAIRAFWDHGIRDIGVMQADHPMTDPTQPVQVASVQTLARRAKPDVGLVLVDECHAKDEALLKWMGSPEMSSIPVIGLSATPWATWMGKHYDDLIVCSTTAKMIEDGFLSNFRVYAPSHPDLSSVKVVAGEYHEGQLADVMNDRTLVADVVETWCRLGDGRPTLCFAVNRAHAKHLQARFEDAGIPCGYIDAYTESSDREIIRKKFHSGEYKVVCNIGTLTKGIDWDVRCLILARPTKSEMLYVQIIGRALRTADGKSDAIILDHSNTTQSLGFVTDIHYDALKSGKDRGTGKGRKEPLPKECPKCTFLKPPKVSVCPCCGFKPDVPAHVEEAEDGELEEVRRGKGGKTTGPKNTIRMGGAWIPLGDFYGELKTYASTRGYKAGWAANKFRDAVGVWPNHYADAPARPVTFEVSSWLKSQQIRWAKKQEKLKAQEVQHVGG